MKKILLSTIAIVVVLLIANLVTSASASASVSHVWVWKDAQDITYVSAENGDASMVSLYLERNGQPMEITKSLWYETSCCIEAVIPADVDAFKLSAIFSAPIIGEGHADEWFNNLEDPYWVVKKKLSVWIDDQAQTRVTYLGEHSLPIIKYYVYGSGEQATTSLWYELSDGSGIEAVIPDNYDAFKVEKWIRPIVEESAQTYWVEDGFWLGPPVPVIHQIFLPLVVNP